MQCPRCGAKALADRDGAAWCIAHGEFTAVERVEAEEKTSRKAGRPWSADEDAFLRAHLATWTSLAIAEALGRTEKGVAARIAVLGLKKTYVLKHRQLRDPFPGTRIAPAARLMLEILRQAGPGGLVASQRELSAVLGLGQVRHLIADLERRGLVAVERREDAFWGRKASRYALAKPAAPLFDAGPANDRPAA